MNFVCIGYEFLNFPLSIFLFSFPLLFYPFIRFLLPPLFTIAVNVTDKNGFYLLYFINYSKGVGT